MECNALLRRQFAIEERIIASNTAGAICMVVVVVVVMMRISCGRK
jgi:hypothetical protein